VANTKSALKRIKQNERRRTRNRSVRTGVRGGLKAARAALEARQPDARHEVAQAVRLLDRAVTKGVIHRNTAARRKSALMRRLNTLSA
jgi:small subunit ribosomal protein S20